MMRICPDCKASVSDNANFCDNCGFPFKDAPAAQPPPPVQPPVVWSPVSVPAMPAVTPPGVCGACGYQNIPGEMFCQNCGVQLAPVASTPPPPPKQQSNPLPFNPVVSPSAPAASAPASGGEAVSGRCPECSAVTSPSDKFCPNCGVLLRKPELQSAPPASSAPPAPEQPSIATTAPDWPQVFSHPPAPSISKPPTPEPPAVIPPAPYSSPPTYSPPPLSTPAPGWGGPQEQNPAPVPPPQPALPLAPAPAPRSPGKLVVRESGAEIPLMEGKVEWIIGRSDPVRGLYPEVDMTGHGGDTQGVSRRHARLVIQDGQLQIEDLNSTNFTFVNRQRLQPGQLHPLKDGDEIRLGLLALDFRQA